MPVIITPIPVLQITFGHTEYSSTRLSINFIVINLRSFFNLNLSSSNDIRACWAYCYTVYSTSKTPLHPESFRFTVVILRQLIELPTTIRYQKVRLGSFRKRFCWTVTHAEKRVKFVVPISSTSIYFSRQKQ